MSSSAQAAATSTVTDSIFTWTFTATSGDSWGGSLVEDSTRYEVGSTFDSAHGRYTIVAEAAQATDLSGAGFDEGWIAVAWYRDSNGSWLLTELGEAAAAGQAGLGSEQDRAWTGSGWDSFGLGGADQADPAALADSLFTWTFTYANGDLLRGTLLADTVDWDPGDTRQTAYGTYRIDTETPYGHDLGEAGIEGTVRTLAYHDVDAAIDFALESGGSAVTGYAGLGSELDRAWNGAAWQPVGQGGAAAADRQPDRLFEWRFESDSGDRWYGTLVGHSTAFQKGSVLEVAAGRYVISGEAAWSGPVAEQGDVRVTRYWDGSMKAWLPVQHGSGAGALAGGDGLGSELGYAWNGLHWDDFGLAGAARASSPYVFGPPILLLSNFGASAAAGSWSSIERYPRTMADVNGDGAADVVGFGEAGMYVALADGAGGFGAMALRVANFGASAAAGRWSSAERYPRTMADVNGDGAADVVGFGEAGMYAALADGAGGFGAMTLRVANFGASAAAGGWSSIERYPRTMADVNGDGAADVVGFGEAGMYAALADGAGGFGAMTLRVANFGASAAAGGWSSSERYPRTMADVNGDGAADVVGFGEAGMYVALADGAGGFGTMALRVANFGASAAAGRWSSAERYPRTMADVNGDGAADVVGFGEAGTYVALADGAGGFGPMALGGNSFGRSAAAGGWTSADRYPRTMADVNNDGFADVVGFGEAGMVIAFAERDSLV